MAAALSRPGSGSVLEDHGSAGTYLHKSCSAQWGSRTAHTGGHTASCIPPQHPTGDGCGTGCWDGRTCSRVCSARSASGPLHSRSSRLPPPGLRTPSSAQHRRSHAAGTGCSCRHSQGRQGELQPCSSSSSSCSSQRTRNLGQVPHGCPTACTHGHGLPGVLGC